MASLLSEILLNPSPTKDFYQCVITQKEIIWRWWEISVRTELRGAPPGEIKQFHNDFLNDSRLQCKDPASVIAGFGSRILEYSLALCRETSCSLKSFPTYPYRTNLKQSMICIVNLSMCMCFQLCNSGEIWKQAVLGHCDVINEDMEMLAKVMGWMNISFKVCHNKEHVSMACPAEEEDQANAEYPYELLKTTFSQSTRKSYDLIVY
uniref:Uncharacterized protein n=1 Tax=Sinocyclocheilus grahami TaxID=75366 RepID=A0A672R8J3_SINGR